MTCSTNGKTVLYTSPIVGEPWPVAECTTIDGALAVAKWANLNQASTNRRFSGIADELDALADFTGDIQEFVSSLDMGSPERIALAAILNKLNERGCARTWTRANTPNLAPEFEPEPSRR